MKISRCRKRSYRSSIRRSNLTANTLVIAARGLTRHADLRFSIDRFHTGLCCLPAAEKTADVYFVKIPLGNQGRNLKLPVSCMKAAVVVHDNIMILRDSLASTSGRLTSLADFLPPQSDLLPDILCGHKPRLLLPFNSSEFGAVNSTVYEKVCDWGLCHPALSSPSALCKRSPCWPDPS